MDAVLMEGNHMAENILSKNEVATLLIKQYDAMRTELRDYSEEVISKDS